jgi:hypothetical protein
MFPVAGNVKISTKVKIKFLLKFAKNKHLSPAFFTKHGSSMEWI